MTIDGQGFCAILRTAAEALREKTGYLGEIDSRFGDGDHGFTMGKIAGVILENTGDWSGGPMKAFLETLGGDIMGVGGGSAGPLYGTFVGGLGEPLEDEETLDGPTFKQMLAGALEAMEEITKARVGDKTMMDALIPAVAAAQSASDEIQAVLDAAAEAAENGARATEGFVSKFGRARSYKEQTLGTPDAGAVSTATLLRGLAEGCRAL